jgi:tape measure domain-containing protein
MAKSSQNYDELFGFDKIEASLKKLDSLFIELEKNGIAWLNELDKKQKETIDTARALQKVLQSIGLNDPKGAQKIAGMGEDIGKMAGETKKYRDIANSLNITLDANKVSITNLRGAVKILKTDYEKLDPTTADFAKRQKEIADQLKVAKTAIEGQSQALKATNTVLSAAAKNYNDLSAETRDLIKSLKSLDNAYDLNTGKLNKNNQIAVDFAKRIEENQQALKSMDAQMGNHTRNVGDYGIGWQSAKQDLLAFVGVTTVVDTALNAISKAFEVMNTFERYRSVIKFASNDTATFNSNLAMLNKLADQTGMDVEVLYSKFGSFSIAGKSANMTVSETNKLFAAVVKAGGAYKMTNEGISLSLKAFEQIMNKNKLSMEEISQQLGDHMPGALGLFATALGVSTEKLVKMISSGELFAKETLPLVADRLNAAVGKEAQNNVNTMGGSWNRMTNQVKLFIDEFGQIAKVQSFFSTLNNGVATWFQNLRTAVNSGEWASFVAVLLGNPSANRAMVRQRFADENKANDAAQQKEVAYNFMSRLTPQQRDAAIKGKLSEFQDAAQLATSSQAKAREAQELLKVLNLYKEINAELKTKAVSNTPQTEIDRVKALNKEIKDTQRALESKTFANKGFLQTPEGMALKEKYDSLVAERKQLRVSAGISNPAKLKEERTELEKITDELEKIGKLLSNEIISDFTKNGVVDLPMDRVKRWYELYNVLEKISKEFGFNIPANVKQTKEALDNVYYKEGLQNYGSQNVFDSDPTANDYVKAPKDKKVTEKKEKVNKNDLVAEIKSRAAERLSLEQRLSGDLVKMEKEKQVELRRLKIEQQEAERQDNKDKAKQIKEQIDEEIRLFKEKEQKKREMQAMFAQSLIDISQATNDIYSSIQEKKIMALEKQRDYELKMVGDNEAAKAGITEKYAKQIGEIRRKQAVAERAMAVFQIGVNTAVAIMKLWADVPKFDFAASTMALSVLVGITGALQAAAVLSKPLPAYKKGTKNAPEGLALVAEEGPELRESKGKFTLYEHPALANLQQGDKIFTAQETSRMLADNFLYNQEVERFNRSQAMYDEFRQKTQRPIIANSGVSESAIINGMTKGWQNVKNDIIIHQTVIDEIGVRRWNKTKNSAIEYQKSRYKLG